MKFYTILIALFLIFISDLTKAQSLSPEVIGSSGDFYTNTGGSVSFTIGETVVETFNDGSNFLTQGFQQSFIIMTSVPETQNGNSIFAYPNPLKDYLFLDFNSMEEDTYLITVFDVSGKEIMHKRTQISAQFSTYKMSLSDLQDGIYLIRITNENYLSKTVRIIKQN